MRLQLTFSSPPRVSMRRPNCVCNFSWFTSIFPTSLHFSSSKIKLGNFNLHRFIHLHFPPKSFSVNINSIPAFSGNHADRPWLSKLVGLMRHIWVHFGTLPYSSLHVRKRHVWFTYYMTHVKHCLFCHRVRGLFAYNVFIFTHASLPKRRQGKDLFLLYLVNGRFIGEDLEHSPRFGEQSSETEREANRQKYYLQL